ncbi:MAG: zinc transporter ZntB [Planctomycetota bacterium]|nr:zinc transporter ZntB [Planctomycetota bacterium]
MDELHGVHWAYRVTASGRGTRLTNREEIASALESALDDETPDSYLWVHLNHADPGTIDWLKKTADFHPIVVDALLAPETRPRVAVMDDGALVILRGVNLNPGADPEDMVSVRVWVDKHCIVSVQLRRLMAVHAMAEALEAGNGPGRTGDWLVKVADGLIERMGPIVLEMRETVDEMEERLLEKNARIERGELVDVRRDAIILRRYIAPQRDALTQLLKEPLEWINEDDRENLKEVVYDVSRLVEDLDALRDRAVVVDDEIDHRQAERMNRTMYVLSVLAGVFLPLTVLTGLLGINVGGIPLANEPWGFAAVCVILIGLTAIELIALRKMRWL